MYDHFKHIFINKIEAYGRENVELEKEILKKEAHLAEINCRSKKPEKTCNYYKISEGEFLNELRKKQEAKRIGILERQKAEQIAKLKSLHHKHISLIIQRFKHVPSPRKPK